MKQKDEQEGKDRQLVVDDDKRRVLHLGDMRIIPPDVDIFDAPTRCYHVNEQWASIIMGMVSWLAHPAVWQDADDWTYPAISAINRFKVGGNCMNFILRQNPANLCLLEQSTDGGESWTTAFDYSLCISPLANDEIINEIIDLRRSLEAAYDGSIASVAPNVVGDGSGYDDIRALALCDTVYYMVYSFTQAELEKRQLADQTTLTLQNIVDILTGLAGGTIRIDITPLSETISRLLFGLLGADWSMLDESTLTNDTAINDVACCMYNAMDVIGFDREQWRDSADGCGFTVDTDQELIASAIQPFLDNDSVWISFLGFYEAALKDAEDGYITCPCDDDDTWEYVWDFLLDSGAADGWFQNSWGNGWFVGDGWRSEDFSGIGELNYLWNTTLPELTMTYFEVTINCATQPTFNVSGSGGLSMQTVLSGAATTQYTETSFGLDTNRTIVMYDNAAGVTLDTIRLSANPGLSNPHKWHYGQIVIRGTGVNPFI